MQAKVEHRKYEEKNHADRDQFIILGGKKPDFTI